MGSYRKNSKKSDNSKKTAGFFAEHKLGIFIGVFAAVVAAGCVIAAILYNNAMGVHVTTGYMKMGDYSKIEVSESSVEVTDDDVESYLSNMQNYYAVTSDDGSEELPEINDEFIYYRSLDYCGTQVDTLEEMKEYIRDYYYEYRLHAAMLEFLLDKQTVVKYDEALYSDIYAMNLDQLEYNAEEYGLGMSADTYAEYSGFDDADSYCAYYTEFYMDRMMLYDFLEKDAGIEISEEAREEAIWKYMSQNGYTEYYSTVDAFLDGVNSTFAYIVKNLDGRYDLVMDALEGRVEFSQSAE